MLQTCSHFPSFSFSPLYPWENKQRLCQKMEAWKDCSFLQKSTYRSDTYEIKIAIVNLEQLHFLFCWTKFDDILNLINIHCSIFQSKYWSLSNFKKIHWRIKTDSPLYGIHYRIKKVFIWSCCIIWYTKHDGRYKQYFMH